MDHGRTRNCAPHWRYCCSVWEMLRLGFLRHIAVSTLNGSPHGLIASRTRYPCFPHSSIKARTKTRSLLELSRLRPRFGARIYTGSQDPFDFWRYGVRGREDIRAWSSTLIRSLFGASRTLQLHSVLRAGSNLPPTFAEELRSLARRYIDDGDSHKLRAICLLVADLCEQGWRVEVSGTGIVFEPPGIARAGTESVEEVKARVRRGLETARARELRESSVRSFLARMERRTQRPQGRWSSSISLTMVPILLAGSNPSIRCPSPSATPCSRHSSIL